MNQSNKHTKVVDYVFWSILIIFTNPGGIIDLLPGSSGDGGVDITDILFVFLVGCFLIVYDRKKLFEDLVFSKVIKYLFIFLIYYLVVFAFFVPLFKNNPYYSPIATYIKIRHGVINFILVIIVYQFSLRSFHVFLKMFIFSSIIIISLFIFYVATGVEILPVFEMNRSFIATQRLMMTNYGLLYLLIPLGIVLLIFKFKIKFKKLMLLSFVLMFMLWIFSLFRRHILGTGIYFIIASFLFNYIHKKPLVPIQKIISFAIYGVILMTLIHVTFPKYSNATIEAVEEFIYVIEYGESSTGFQDARLGFGKDFMQNLIKKNFVFGTGFDNRWRTKEGDTAGYEASDYPFLASIAMTGIVGLLIFLPVYIVLIKTIIHDIKNLRKRIYDKYSIESFTLILFIVFFIFDLMIYVNWFLPVSLFSHSGHKRWFVFLAMFLAARRVYYRGLNVFPTGNTIK